MLKSSSLQTFLDPRAGGSRISGPRAGARACVCRARGFARRSLSLWDFARCGARAFAAAGLVVLVSFDFEPAATSARPRRAERRRARAPRASFTTSLFSATQYWAPAFSSSHASRVHQPHEPSTRTRPRRHPSMSNVPSLSDEPMLSTNHAPRLGGRRCCRSSNCHRRRRPSELTVRITCVARWGRG